MSEMIERMARVIWDAKLKPGGGGRTLMTFECAPEREWCINTTRAVIEAMREPTEEMHAAGYQAHCNANEDHKYDASYQAMIEAALK